MTVAELITVLKELPQECPVEIAGYTSMEGDYLVYKPEFVEALVDSGEATVVIWSAWENFVEEKSAAE